MAFALANLVKETSATTGTGTWTLAGAVSGFRAWSVVGDANTAYYSAIDVSGNWEVGIGTYTLSGTTLARTTVIASSNSNNAVNFTTTVTISCVDVVEAKVQGVYLNATYTLTSQTAAQKLFNASANGAITLPVGTYRFKCIFALASMSTSSGGFGFGFGGSATLTQTWFANADKKSFTATTSSGVNTFLTTASGSLVISTSATGLATIEGIIRVTVAGTVIPQVSLGVAAAAVVQAGSFCEFERVGGSSSETLTGPNWS